jgi:hypothetical protein
MYQKHPAISSSLVVLLFFMHVKTNLKIHAIDIIYFVLILMLEDKDFILHLCDFEY